MLILWFIWYNKVLETCPIITHNHLADDYHLKELKSKNDNSVSKSISKYEVT